MAQKKKHNQPKENQPEKEVDVINATVSNVVKSTYDKFTNLYFIRASGAKLTDAALKELNELEAELKLCEGVKPIRTVRAAINNEQALLVEGIPVPKEIEQLIKDKGVEKYYFG